MYKVLSTNKFTHKEFKIVPVRSLDRYKIMKWRNEQIYHLRQDKILSREEQDKYFKSIILNQKRESYPDQILFSFLRNNVCEGYGGLVHINWNHENAEISFVMDTSLETDCFKSYWTIFLKLLEKVAFEELILHKVYIYSFNVRPKLYEITKENSFTEEARLKDHIINNHLYEDVLIHSKINYT